MSPQPNVVPRGYWFHRKHRDDNRDEGVALIAPYHNSEYQLLIPAEGEALCPPTLCCVCSCRYWVVSDPVPLCCLDPAPCPDDGKPPRVSVFNLLNCTVSCGVLGLPLAFSGLGWALGTAMLLFMCLINAATAVALVRRSSLVSPLMLACGVPPPRACCRRAPCTVTGSCRRGSRQPQP
jgi:hypothetical protein